MISHRLAVDMQPPQRVAAAVGDEEVTTQIDLGGDDSITLTPTRLLLYRAEGLLSGESISEYPLAARAVSMDVGRRKATIRLEYPEADAAAITVPAATPLEPILAAVLRAHGIVAADEQVRSIYRLSQLTVIVGEQRIIRNVGANIWDTEYEMFAYEDVTDIDYEKGDVATTIVLTVDGRSERIKVPNEEIITVRKDVEGAVCGFWDVETVPQLRRLHGTDGERPTQAKVSFGDGPAPLELGVTEEGPAGIDRVPDGATTTTPPATEDIGAQLAAQTAAIEELSALVEQLITELKAGR